MCFFEQVRHKLVCTTEARNFGFRKGEELYYPCRENKGADQLSSYREADLRLCFQIMQIIGFLIMRLISYSQIGEDSLMYAFIIVIMKL